MRLTIETVLPSGGRNAPTETSTQRIDVCELCPIAIIVGLAVLLKSDARRPTRHDWTGLGCKGLPGVGQIEGEVSYAGVLLIKQSMFVVSITNRMHSTTFVIMTKNFERADEKWF